MKKNDETIKIEIELDKEGFNIRSSLHEDEVVEFLELILENLKLNVEANKKALDEANA